MFESLFEFFFKYRPLIFQQGDFALRASWLGYLALGVAGVAAFLTLRTYAGVRGNSRPIDRTVLTAIRVAALAVLCFCLLRPESPRLGLHASAWAATRFWYLAYPHRAL